MNDFERFLATKRRRIAGLPSMDWIEGTRILVTGGTGCIGSRLMTELNRHHPAQLVSISLEPETALWPKVPGADYRKADIRNRPQLTRAMTGEWDVVFHTAAQRNPGLAEKVVWETVTTNIFGSANVLEVAEKLGVPRIIFASTGKTLRPFSREVYTASKRIAECLLAASAIPVRGLARFTHVIDNSVFYEKLLDWAYYGRPIELHGRDIVFYIQSATEAAELLMGLAATCGENVPQGHAITWLDFPVSLYDLAVEARNAMVSDSEVLIAGYDPGYEEVAFPGLYDPDTAGEVSALLNAFEAAEAWTPYPGVDAFPLRFSGPVPYLGTLRAACDPRQQSSGTVSPSLIRTAMNDVSWDVMRSAVAAAPPGVVEKVGSLCKQYEPLSWPHDKMLAIINEAAGASTNPGLRAIHVPTDQSTIRDR